MNQKEYVLIAVFSPDLKEILLQWKAKGPYPNAWNIPGGKVEPTDISAWSAARRELFEETGLMEKFQKRLIHLLNIQLWNDVNLYVWVCVVKDKSFVKQKEDEPLSWNPVDDFLSQPVTYPAYAGEGNLQYIINLARNILKQRK